MQTRVLIVEDQTALAENLLEFLGENRYQLDFAADGLTALHLLATQDYDVVVLDVMLPGPSGFEICRRLRHDLGKSTPVIFMTARGELPDKEQGFNLGGDDYLVKPFALRELQLRIDALARRRQSASPVVTAGNVGFDPGTLEVTLAGAGRLELTGTPARIFDALIRQYPGIVSHEQLSRHIWGIDDGDLHALRTHVYTLRKQLNQAFGISLVRNVHGRGYRLTPPTAESSA